MERPYNEILRDERLRRGWTQEQLAEKLNFLEKNTVSRWERGEHYPQLYYRRQLAQVFDTSLEELGLDTDVDPRRMETILLSSPPDDEEMAHHIREYFKKRWINVFSCTDKRKKGKVTWDDIPVETIRRFRVMVLIISPSARASQRIREDLAKAEAYNIPVIGYWIAGQRWSDVLPVDQQVIRAIDVVDVRQMHHPEELVLSLDRLREKLRSFLPPLEGQQGPLCPGLPRNPYKGLRAFETEDAYDFFGRDHLVDLVFERLALILATQEEESPCARLFAVIGPSGSGKSSLMKAGVLPRLQRPFSELEGSSQWLYLSMRPTSRPLQELAEALKKALVQYHRAMPEEELAHATTDSMLGWLLQWARKSHTRLLLFVDQFEEIFAPTVAEQERKEFIDVLLHACTCPRGPLCALLTIRTDAFYGRILSYSGNGQFGRIIDQQHYLIQPMSKHELAAAIWRPAVQPDVQVTFEDHLVEDLLHEVHGQSGALPLLQFTLARLFNQCIDHTHRCITRKAYNDIKGVRGSLHHHAEKTYQMLKEHEKDRCKSLFLRLINPGMIPEDSTRRRLLRDELPESMDLIVDTFTCAHLLTIDRRGSTETIEISHEALISAWERLQTWVQESVKHVSLRQSLYWDANHWLEHQRSPAYYYQGAKLKEAQALQKQHLLNPLEKDFVSMSMKEQGRRLRLQWSCTALLTSLLFCLIGITVWSWFDVHQSDVVMVTTPSPTGPGSLLAALRAVNDRGIINLDSGQVHQLLLEGERIDIDKNVTIRVVGGLAFIIRSMDTVSHIHVDKGVTVTIEGLILIGNNLAPSPDQISSLIFNEGSLQLINCKLENNRAISGGGMLNRGNATLIHTTVTGNSADHLGGGIDNEGGVVKIMQESTISDNSARDGGGIYNFYGQFDLNSVFFIENQALGGSGGAIADQMSKGTIRRSEFLSNEAIASAKPGATSGGAILDLNGELMLTECILSYNHVQGDGGAMMLQGSNATIASSTISGNQATFDGGAFAVRSNMDNGRKSELTLTKNTISDNSAGRLGRNVWIDGTSVSKGLPPNEINTSSQPVSATPSTVVTQGNLNAYCTREGYQVASLDDPSTAYGWSCVSFDQNHFGLSMTDVCRMLYPRQAVIDRIANIHDPWSWQCWLLRS